MIQWFAQSDLAAEALQQPLHEAVPERALLRGAIKMVALRFSLDESAVGALEAAGFGIHDLQAALERLAAALARTPGSARVATRAARYLAGVAPGLRFLLPGPLLDKTVGVALVRSLSEELFPVETEGVADADAPLRRAFCELVALRGFEPGTLEALDASGRQRLASRLGATRETLIAISPPGAQEALASVIATAVALLDQPSLVSAETFNTAIAPR